MSLGEPRNQDDVPVPPEPEIVIDSYNLPF